MSDQSQPPAGFSEHPLPLRPGRNPYEIGIGVAGIVALFGGILLFAVNDYAVNQAASEGFAYYGPSDYYIGYSTGVNWGALGSGLAWGGLATLGALGFYFMTRWNKTHHR
ncbi:hypothetical protein KPL76_00060 [Subtercola sp. PAMC28395]|uniref:hypothetical protein n=1 Tax=Subtercola sp. PAMC28395 TaxID=2846775 RepID=UPI001C0D50BB|nr:hypothetical protein [Subtercola sp. PAMC28395]QWT23891.1 hypothetical protein KPL76_00060 [Subtercola sp. PAMC28395]